jgi:two-component system response regulator
MNEEIEILLVEDNATDAELTLRALKRNNLTNKVLWVKDGAEALEVIYGTGKDLNQFLPKVIFLDLKLPKVSGLEFLRKLKSDDRTKTIPIVVLTSSKEDKDISESYALGVNSYVAKPLEFDNFIKAVSEVGLYWLLLNRPSK